MVKNKEDKNHIIGQISPLGAVKVLGGVQFACILEENATCKLLIYDKAHNLLDSVLMNDFRVSGDIASVVVTKDLGTDFSYCYEVDGQCRTDAFMKKSTGRRKYGDFEAHQDEAMLYVDDFDWEEDRPLKLRFSDIVAYQLHVRGFTKHASSKTLNRGTFGGVTEKISHLKSLGINQVVLMPCYEFDEREMMTGADSLQQNDYMKNPDEKTINYWGFKEGFYYCPKASYAQNDAVFEFKSMIKALHKAGIEVVMRMYFPATFNATFVLDILHFYVCDYHIDGFFLMGPSVPMQMIASDPGLFDTKLYNAFFDKDSIKAKSYKTNENLAFANSDFGTVCRKFLKSDDNMLYEFVSRQRLNPSDVHVVNYITDYCGFTLNDLVSYDYKHNEDNNENNRDGENYNYSWNCGVEGDTRRKSILALRQKQIKNAFVFLLMSHGVPMILSGDEFLNSQGGNNNPYCQDNEIGWVVWKNNKQSAEIFEFVKLLISIRNEHPVLHPTKEFRIMDYAACGFPDLSYHSESPWVPKFDNYLRHIGLMLCGNYAKKSDGYADDFFYIAYNMHWENHEFALPILPKGLEWKIIVSSDANDDKVTIKASEADGVNKVVVDGRCVCIIKSAEIKNDNISVRKEDNDVR